MYNKRNARRRWGIWYVCPSLPLFRVCALFFPGSSLSVEAPLIGAFSRGHRFGEVSIERGANFFQPNLVRFHLLLWTDRESLHPLKNTNQPVQIPVPQKKFAVVVCFQYSRFLSPTLRSEFRPPCVLKRAGACSIGLHVGGVLVRSRTVVDSHQQPRGRKADHSVRDATKKRFAWCFRVMEEVRRPAQDRREPETWGAWRVAPKIGNG